jgi:hypothetical protein
VVWTWACPTRRDTTHSGVPASKLVESNVSTTLNT